MYGIYANIGGIWMGSMLPYIAYMDPMEFIKNLFFLPNFPCSFLEVQPPSSTRLLLGQLRIEGHQGVAARRRRSCLGFHWVYSGAPKRYKVVYKPSYKPY